MTELVVCGLSYHSVPVAIRERFTIPQSCLKHALEGLKRFPHIKEAAVLSTCNRTEVYAVVSDIQAGWQEIDAFFAATQTIADHGELKPNFRLLRQDVALHLMRVAAGLDSMVLGEGQIMAQVKVAHQEALQAQAAGPILDALFKFALSCGKRVRSETAMGRRAVSISSAAVELGKSLLGGFQDKTILVIGVGKMGQICLKHLVSDGSAAKVLVANRSPEKINSFLKNSIRNLNLLSPIANFDDRHKAAQSADLVIVASSAPHHVLTVDEWNGAGAALNKDVCVIDIGVPRNVEPKLAELANVRLFDFDHLAEIVQINLAEREALVADAEKIVFEVLRHFDDWQRSLLVVPTIAELREKIESIRQEQMQKGCLLRESEDDLEAHRELEGISRAIVNQILHHPTTQLKATTDYEILKQQAEALRTLFNLNPLVAGATSSRQRSAGRKSTTVNQLN
jgi:glutamyl-tRNA reductase